MCSEDFRPEIETIIESAKAAESTFYDQAARLFEAEDTYSSFPLKVLWELDSLCNLQCPHCWAATSKSVSQPPLHRQIEIVDEIGTNGALEVSISGGEPLISDRLEPILRRLTEYDISVQLLTNGELIPQEIDWLTEVLGTGDRIQVSVDGPELVHESQRPGSDFKRLEAGIEAMSKTDIELTVNDTVTHVNQDYLEETLMWCFDRGIRSVSISPVFPAGDGIDFWERQSPNDYLNALARVLPEHETEGTVFVPVELYRYLPESLISESPTKPIVGLEAGNTILQIQANGDIYPGGGLTFPEYQNGNILDRDLTDAWKDDTWDDLRSGRDLCDTKCSNCKRFKYCQGGSHRLAYRMFGTIHRPDPFCNHVPPHDHGISTSYEPCYEIDATDKQGETK